ncbi:glycosyltransferase [[Ruminococcus] lactaris]|uniref:glycosyltransferase n=1 Tax=[Ruminococcus] lactaris TaxID=46228 RepID=UPI0032C1C4DE
MVILHILNTGSFSGAENVVISIINEFQKRNIENTELIYVSLEGSIRERLEKEKIKYEPIKKMSIGEIKRVIKKYNPDIIHAHDFTASIICAVSAKKISVISHIHNNCPWLKKFCLKTLAYGMTCFKYKYMLGVSDSVFEEFIFGRFFAKKEKIVGNPIDTSKIKLLAENSKSFEKYDVTFLGRLSQEKNPLEFVNIIYKINKKMSVTAVMIGDGKLQEEVKTLIEKMHLQNIIILKGFMDNPYGILNNTKVVCMPSVWEGFGLVAVEALTLGKPVVASRVGGLPGIVNESCGRICDLSDEITDEIVSLLSDDLYYERKSLGAIERAKEMDNIEAYILGIKKIYVDLYIQR